MTIHQKLLDFTWTDFKGKKHELPNGNVWAARLMPGTPGHDLLLNTGVFEELNYAQRRKLLFDISRVVNNPESVARLMDEKGDCFNQKGLEGIIERLQNEKPSPIRVLIEKAVSHLPREFANQYDRRSMLSLTAKAAVGAVAGAAIGDVTEKGVKLASNRVTEDSPKPATQKASGALEDGIEKPRIGRDNSMLSRQNILNALPEIIGAIGGALIATYDFDKNRDIRQIADYIDFCVLERAKQKGLVTASHGGPGHSGQNLLPTHGR